MATLVAISTPREGEDEALKSYVGQVIPLLIAAGGQVVKRLGVTDVLAGDADPGTIFVMDFDDAATARAIFDGAEYQALIPVRDRGFERMEIFITEDL